MHSHRREPLTAALEQKRLALEGPPTVDADREVRSWPLLRALGAIPACRPRSAVGFAGCSMPSCDRALASSAWLDSWPGIGQVAVGMHRGPSRR